MPHPIRIGLYLWPQIDSGVARAEWADAAGYDDVWIGDGGGMQDGLTLAGAVAARTSHLRVCTGIVPVYTRPAAVLATSAQAINAIAPGRFALGLGSSTEAMVARWYGRDFVKPVTAVRETIEVLREIFAGRKTDFEGQVIRSSGFRLLEPIQGEIPILGAAMGPKMLEMVGEFGDGVVLNNFTPLARIPWALEHLDAGAKRAGRRVEDLEVASRVALTVTDDHEAARELFRREVYNYGSTEIYRNIIARIGFGAVAEQLAEGFRRGDRKAILAAIPDELVETLFTWGGEAACQQRVREFVKAGVTTVGIGPMSPEPGEFQRTCEAFAPGRFDPTS